MEKYTYSIAEDTKNGKVDLGKLTQQIGASIITIALDKIETVGDVLDIWFKLGISAGEQTVLDAIVAAHDGESLSPPMETVETIPSNKFAMQRDGCCTTFTAGATGTMDFKIENHDAENFLVKYLWGADFMAKDSEFFDWAAFSIIDKDNVLGYGVDVVIKKYVLKKYVFSSVHIECNAFAPGAVPVGLYLRCEYHSTGSSDVKFAINYHIEVKE